MHRRGSKWMSVWRPERVLPQRQQQERRGEQRQGGVRGPFGGTRRVPCRGPGRLRSGRMPGAAPPRRRTGRSRGNCRIRRPPAWGSAVRSLSSSCRNARAIRRSRSAREPGVRGEPSPRPPPDWATPPGGRRRGTGPPWWGSRGRSCPCRCRRRRRRPPAWSRQSRARRTGQGGIDDFAGRASLRRARRRRAGRCRTGMPLTY